MAIKFDPFECMMTHSTCYRSTTTMSIKGVLWHSTGAENDSLKRYVQPYEGDKDYEKKISKLGLNRNHNDWNHVEKQAGLNCWIGRFADGSVGTVQTMPWNFRPWGCGSREYYNKSKKKYEYGPSCNDGWIQFEICEDDLKNKSYAEAVWNEAVNFTAWICDMYNLDPMGTVKKKDYYGNMINVPVILDHKTAWSLGFGSGHGDIQHWFPKILGKDMDDARKEVKALIDASKKDTGYEVGKTYQVVCSELNIRTEPNTTCKVVGSMKKGTKVTCESTTRESNRIWMRIDKGWACCVEGTDVYISYVGWSKQDDGWHYYDSDGKMVTNNWINYKGKWYYAGSTGAIVTGWNDIDGKKYYLYPEDGHMAKSEWIDGLWINGDGSQTYPYKGSWKNNSKGKWWEDENGYYPKNKVERINKIDYSFDPNGYLIGG